MEEMYKEAKAAVKARGWHWPTCLGIARTLNILFPLENKKTKKLQEQYLKKPRVRAVAAFVKGKKIGEWSTIKSASQELGVNQSTISRCAKGMLYSAGRHNGIIIQWRFVEK